MATRRNSDSRGPRQGRSRKPKKKKIDARKFWGDPASLAELESDNREIVVASQPEAMFLSLGRPPLSAPQTTSEERFGVVYVRASMLAAALAAAGNLIEPEELSDI